MFPLARICCWRVLPHVVERLHCSVFIHDMKGGKNRGSGNGMFFSYVISCPESGNGCFLLLPEMGRTGFRQAKVMKCFSYFSGICRAAGKNGEMYSGSCYRFMQNMVPGVFAGFGIQDGLHQCKMVDVPYYWFGYFHISGNRLSGQSNMRPESFFFVRDV